MLTETASTLCGGRFIDIAGVALRSRSVLNFEGCGTSVKADSEPEFPPVCRVGCHRAANGGQSGPKHHPRDIPAAMLNMA